MKFQIMDGSFLFTGQKSASLMGECASETPKHFEWEKVDVPDPERICFFTDVFLSRAKDYPCKKRIALPLESPPFRQGNWDYLREHESEFDYIFSFLKEDYGRNEKWLYRPMCGSAIPMKYWGVYPKTKFCSMVISGKKDTPGQVFRHEVAEAVKDKIDVMGSGVGSFVNIIDGLRDYAYSIAVETSNAEWGYSDHILECFAVGTIPLYWGPNGYEQVFNADGIRRFETIEDLNNLLPALDKFFYSSKIDAVADNMYRSVNYRCLEDWLFENQHVAFEE